MTKFYTLSLGLLAGALMLGTSQQASARQLSVDEALASARKISKVALLRGSRSGSELKLVHTETNNSQPTLYVLGNEEGGYVVLSADDAAIPVLGYSESGSFDPKNIPADLKAWLEHYSEQIAYASVLNVPAPTAAAPAYATVENKITASRWRTGSPYNDYCPRLDDKVASAGSGAVAVAQIMRVHEWPEKGTGAVNYSNGSGQYECKFDTISFAWDKMPKAATMPGIIITPITPLSSPGSRAADDEDINLVKSLLMAVGYGIKTNYGVDNSFADGYDVAYALVNYFGYDKGLNYISRNFYTQADWNKKIYDELVNNGPVYYDGKNASYTGKVADGGFYSFVIDGYNQEQGGFHIVFGNNSTTTAPFDGYFHLDILEGKGWNEVQYAEAAGYNASQGAIFGLKKAQAGSTEEVALYADGTLNIYQAGSAKGVYNNTFPIKNSNGQANSFNWFNGAGIKLACVPTAEIDDKGLQYIIGLECTPVDGGDKVYIGLTNPTLRPGYSSAIGTGVGTSYIITNLTKNVKYTVRLVAQRGKASMPAVGVFNSFNPGVPYEPIISSVGDVSELSLSYDDTHITVSAPAGQLPVLDASIGLFTAEGTLTTEIDATKAYFVTARIENTGAEYLGTVYPYLYDKFGHNTKLTPITVNVPAGESTDAQWYEQFDGNLYNTEYTLVLRDKNDNNIGNAMTVNIINGQNLTDLAVIKSITFDTELGDYTQDDIVAPRVDQIFNAAVEIECLSDTYVQSAIYPIFRDTDGNVRYYDPYPFSVDLKKGETFVFNPADGIGNMGLKINTLYQFCFATYDGTWNAMPFADGSDFTWIYVTNEKSGIRVIKEDSTCTVYPNPAESVTTVSADEAISEIAVYSMSGALVLDRRYDSCNTSEQLDVTTLPAGHYVLRIVAGGQNKAARLIKR